MNVKPLSNLKIYVYLNVTVLQAIQSINIVFCFICFSDIFTDVIYNQRNSNERNDIFCQNSKLNET